MNAPAIELERLGHRYGQRQALVDLSLSIEPGEIFVFLGPNGGGKTTLFRLLSTLIPIQAGAARIAGFDLSRQTLAVCETIGVVFQSPSLDKKLTVGENLRCQGRLYGLNGRALAERSQELLARFGLSERVNDRVESLSGGLRRRVELAKGLLHRPRVLLLDEPSAGLDPAARGELWSALLEVRAAGATVALTSHHLDEADKADRIAILDEGRLVALGRPAEMRGEVGGDSIVIEAEQPETLAAGVRERFGCAARVVDGGVRLELPDGHLWIPRLVEAFPGQFRAIALAKPSLEDVFIARTGRRFLPREGAIL